MDLYNDGITVNSIRTGKIGNDSSVWLNEREKERECKGVQGEENAEEQEERKGSEREAQEEENK